MAAAASGSLSPPFLMNELATGDGSMPCTPSICVGVGCDVSLHHPSSFDDCLALCANYLATSAVVEYTGSASYCRYTVADESFGWNDDPLGLGKESQAAGAPEQWIVVMGPRGAPEDVPEEADVETSSVLSGLISTHHTTQSIIINTTQSINSNVNILLHEPVRNARVEDD